MNIENGTSDEFYEGQEIVISRQVKIIEIGGNYVTVESEDGDEYDITDSSDWFVEILR